MKLVIGNQTVDVVISDLFVPPKPEVGFGLGCVFHVTYPDGKTDVIKYCEEKSEQHEKFFSAIHAKISAVVASKNTTLRCYGLKEQRALKSSSPFLSFVGDYYQSVMQRYIAMLTIINNQRRKAISEHSGNKLKLQHDLITTRAELALLGTPNGYWATLSPTNAENVYQLLTALEILDTSKAIFANQASFTKKVTELNTLPVLASGDMTHIVLDHINRILKDLPSKNKIALEKNPSYSVTLAANYMQMKCMINDLSNDSKTYIKEITDACLIALGVLIDDSESIKAMDAFFAELNDNKLSFHADLDVVLEKDHGKSLVDDKTSAAIDKTLASLLGNSMSILPSKDPGDAKEAQQVATAKSTLSLI